jgi:hypothetical protein
MHDIGKHTGDLIILFMCFNVSEKITLYIYKIIYTSKDWHGGTPCPKSSVLKSGIYSYFKLQR